MRFLQSIKMELGFLIFHPEPNHIDAGTNKMFEYMYAELPVVASDFPSWRKCHGKNVGGPPPEMEPFGIPFGETKCSEMQ